MKRLILAAVTSLVAAAPVPKDRAAIMYYTGHDSVISVVASADSANLGLIVLTQVQGESVPVARLAGRGCLGVALFSRAEVAISEQAGRRIEDLRPKDAALRLRVYAASGSDPITIQNVASRETYAALGIDESVYLKSGGVIPPLKGTIERHLAGLGSTCTAD